MPVTTVQMYQIPTGALIGTGTVGAQYTLTISDDDNILHNNSLADPGTDQTFSSPGQSIPNGTVQFFYTFRWTPSGASEPQTAEAIVLQLTFNGTPTYFMIAEMGNLIPDLAAGASITMVSRIIYARPISYDQLACFAAGTLIDTPGGPRPVEEIRPGDFVLTLDHGARRVCWAGRNRLGPLDLAARPEFRPIRIAAGAFGPGLPATDLFLSPQHRVLLTGWRVELFFGESEILVPVKQLLGWPGISVVEDCAGISYHHLMFEAHEIVRANGMPAESFYLGDRIRDGMERAQADEILALFPELASRTPAPARRFSKAFEVCAMTPV